MWLKTLWQHWRALGWKLEFLLEELHALGWRLAAIWSYDPETLPVAANTDHDAAAPPPSNRLTSPQRVYTLDRKIASGDLCDVHQARAGALSYVIKTPRDGSLAAARLLAKEIQILQQLTTGGANNHYASYFPLPVESFLVDDGGPRRNVLAWEDGFSTAGEIAIRYPGGLDGRHLAWMFKRILVALGYAHRQGWIHGAVLPPHLLFHAERHGLHLVDWIHAVRPREPLSLAPSAFKTWYPPECRNGAVPGTDIYLAAKSMVFLAGGDPERDDLPAHLPGPLRSFFQGCLLHSPQMRPGDAWRLHDEFDELLSELYGPARYVQLCMN